MQLHAQAEFDFQKLHLPTQINSMKTQVPHNQKLPFLLAFKEMGKPEFIHTRVWTNLSAEL